MSTRNCPTCGQEMDWSSLNPSSGAVKGLKRGTVVQAIRNLDSSGAKVREGTQGVVFEEANFHEPNSGPMVRWVNMGMCNIYIGDVKVISD